MPIKKLNLIKNVGRFKNCASGHDVDFARHTLIFAANGRGKTTLCAVLRSLQANDGAIVNGRATLGSTSAPEIVISVDGGNISFKQGTWSGRLDDLAIFDATFVSENVYSGDAVGHDHRRSLYQVIVGKEGRELAKTYEDWDTDVRKKSEQVRKAREAVQVLMPQMMTVDAYLALVPEPDAEKKIAAKEREILAANEAATLQARAGFSELPVPGLPSHFLNVLGSKVDGIAANVGDAVAVHLTAHGMQVGGERWLAEGLGYREKGDTCPFCAQSLVSTDFVKTLKYFFSKEYDALKNRVHALHAETNNALGDRVSGNIETIVATNTATAEFWKKHLAVEPPVLDDHDVGEELRALRISASGLVERKTHAVLEPIEPDGDFNKKVSKLVEMVHALEHYNVAVTRANEMIAQLKVDVKAINQQAAIKEVARLKAQQHRYEKKAVEICDAVASRKKEKEEAEAQKDASKQALDKYTETVMVSYEQAINRYLDDFHTGFSLTKTTYDYRGAGVPRSSYQIVINNVPIELGDAETPLHTPSFKNTLSSGDRSTLALAFFLAQLDRDAAKAKKIVVLDDPFTSQDRFRQSETVSKITRCGESCAQVIVLSHDLKFLEMLWSRLQPKAVDCKALQFVGRGEENTHIEALDIDKATNATYRQDFEEMQRFYSDGIGAPLDISRKIRPTVEAHLRHTRSDLADAVSLGKMLAVIRAGGENHPLARQYKELEDINEYATKYHHGEKPGAPAHQIDDQELRGCIKKTRRVIDIG